jgi:hypothetical protein
MELGLLLLYSFIIVNVMVVDELCTGLEQLLLTNPLACHIFIFPSPA